MFDFLHTQKPDPIPSPAILERIGAAFRKAVHRFAARRQARELIAECDARLAAKHEMEAPKFSTVSQVFRQ